MRFDINLVVTVDPEANFLEAYGNHAEVVGEIVQDSLYDIDDMIVIYCEVKDAK